MLKQIWNLYKLRLLFIVLTLVMMFPLDAVVDKLGWNAYCIFICLVYLPFVFFDSYKMAGYDKKEYTKTRAFELKGFALGILSELPPIIVLLLIHCFTAGSAIYQNLNLIYILLMFPFMGFLGLPTYMSVYYYPPLLIIPITAGIGYMLGYREIELVERIFSKIIYVDDKKKK